MRAELIPLIEKLIAKTKEGKLYWKDVTAVGLIKNRATLQHEFNKCFIRVSHKVISKKELRFEPEYSKYEIEIKPSDGRKASMTECEIDYGDNIEKLLIKELYYSAEKTCASINEVSVIDSTIEELDHIN
jgi:hypothetical protein